MNKATIIQLLTRYSTTAKEAVYEQQRRMLTSLMSAEDMTALVSAIDTAQILENRFLETLKSVDPSQRDRAARGMNGSWPVRLTRTAEHSIEAMFKDLACNTVSYADIQNVADKFDVAITNIKKCRTPKAIKEILEKIGLPEIQVEDNVYGAVDYEAVRNMILAVKAIEAPKERNDGHEG